MSEKYKREHLAKEADAILSNDVLRHAMAELRIDTLEELARCDAADTMMVLRGQQTVRVLDRLVSRLEGYILDLPDDE